MQIDIFFDLLFLLPRVLIFIFVLEFFLSHSFFLSRLKREGIIFCCYIFVDFKVSNLEILALKNLFSSLCVEYEEKKEIS